MQSAVWLTCASFLSCVRVVVAERFCGGDHVTNGLLQELNLWESAISGAVPNFLVIDTNIENAARAWLQGDFRDVFRKSA